MAILATDTFVRANNADLGTSWDVEAGSWKIVSNTAQPTSLSSDGCERNNAATWPNDQYAEANCSVTGTLGGGGAGIGPAVRISTGGTGTFYRAVVNNTPSSNCEIAKLVAGAYTSLASRTFTLVSGDLIRLQAVGTTLSVWQNGVQLGASVTDSTIAAGRAGVAYSSSETGAFLSAWAGGDFTVTGPTRPRQYAGMTPTVQRAGFW